MIMFYRKYAALEKSLYKPLVLYRFSETKPEFSPCPYFRFS